MKLKLNVTDVCFQDTACSTASVTRRGGTGSSARRTSSACSGDDDDHDGGHPVRVQ